MKNNLKYMHNVFTIAKGAVHEDMLAGKYKTAFTLAEVLITLGIIGIIAAMTMPTIINKANDKANIARLKKTYTLLSQALMFAKNDYEDYQYWPIVDYDMNSTIQIYNFLKPRLKVTRECPNEKGCWAQVRSLSNVALFSEAGMGDSVYNFSLIDGTNVSMNIYSSDADRTKYGVTDDPLPVFIGFFVDVNGDKKPNQMGKDVFLFILTKKGLVPAGSNVDNENSDCKKDGDGYMCASRALAKGSTDLD